MNRKRSKPKRQKTRLNEAHGYGHVKRITPTVLERIHNETAPAWARRKGATA